MQTSAISVCDAKSLVDAIRFANSTFQGQVWWRGHACPHWRLVPSVFREDRGHQYEQGIISRFQQRAPSRHPSIPPLDQRIMWLFLMQHYRLPTRLLDWTESPLFACHFALEDCPESLEHRGTSSCDGALYALSPYELNRHQVHQFGAIMPDDRRATAAIAHAFKSGEDDVDYVAAILPAEVDIRMMVQLSVFTVHGSGIALDDLTDNNDFLIRFPIPEASKAGLREELKHMGVRQASLFPDLEHLAQETAALRFKRPPRPQPPLTGPDLIIDISDRDVSPST